MSLVPELPGRPCPERVHRGERAGRSVAEEPWGAALGAGTQRGAGALEKCKVASA